MSNSTLQECANRIAWLLFLGVLCAVSAGCDTCGEDPIAEKRSPDGKYVAVVYRRGCGATTPFVTHVNLRLASESFSLGWDGAIRSGEVLSVKNQEPIDIVWGDAELKLLVNTGAIIKCADSMAGIRVSCSAPKGSP
jgi:hypothetical protein